MHQLPDMTEQDLKDQSIVYVTQSVVRTWLYTLAIVVAGGLLLPISVKTLQASLPIKLLVGAFFQQQVANKLRRLFREK